MPADMKLSTNLRWNIKNVIISGAVTKIVAAIRRVQSAPLSC